MFNSGALAGVVGEHLTTAVLLFDEAFRLGLMNAAAEDLLSVSQRQMKGMKVEHIIPGKNAFSGLLQRSFETGSPYSEWAMEIELLNEKKITVDCVFTPINVKKSGKHVLVEMTNSNFYNRIAREETLISQNLTTKELGRALAHEIKNPLGGIRGAAQLLRQELEEDGLKEYTDIVINEADRLRNLVDKILTPDKELSFAEENIHEILQYVLHLLHAEKDISSQFISDYDPSLPEIFVDRESLVQVFLNLLRNANQAVNNQGQIIIKTRATHKVTIAHQLHKLCIRIDIIDDGPGVDENLVDRIFYPMITTRAEGTGLGLPIAQSLVQKHGGIIEYNRNQHKTTFTVLIPWRDSTDE